MENKLNFKTSKYTVYCPLQLEMFKRGVKLANAIKPLFTDELSKAKEYQKAFPATRLFMTKNIFPIKLVDLTELYCFLDNLGATNEIPEVAPPNDLPPPVRRKRGRPKKEKL